MSTRQPHLFLAVPMYGGNCTVYFVNSLIQLVQACSKVGVAFSYHFVYNDALITRARNECVDVFLRSAASHLLFVDADIGFDAADVIELLGFGVEDRYRVIGAVYPKKSLDWKRVLAAADAGLGDDDPSRLAHFGAYWNFNRTSDGPQKYSEIVPFADRKEPFKVSDLATGFMLIQRGVFARLRDAFPAKAFTHYLEDGRVLDRFAYFDCEIEPEQRRYLSEDGSFCYRCLQIGISIWVCPWMTLTHFGSFAFGGSLAAQAAMMRDGST